MSIERKVLEWLANGETGVSSETMAMAACGIKRGWSSHPYDPADFNRCLMLIKAVPEIKYHMDKIAKISATWGKLVDHWDEVEECFINEVGLDWCNGRRAPKTYNLMKQIGC